MVERTTRTLSGKERRALRARLASLRTQSKALARRVPIAAAVLCGPLAILTVMVTNVRWVIALAAWCGIALVIGAWAWIEESGKHRARVEALESALKHDSADELRVQAVAVVELEEIEDEGACYAFDVGDGTLLFITGQEYYASRRFPSTDFLLVHVHDTGGEVVEFYLETRGERLQPVRTVSAEERGGLREPEHLERVEASLAHLDRVLAG